MFAPGALKLLERWGKSQLSGLLKAARRFRTAYISLHSVVCPSLSTELWWTPNSLLHQQKSWLVKITTVNVSTEFKTCKLLSTIMQMFLPCLS